MNMHVPQPRNQVLPFPIDKFCSLRDCNILAFADLENPLSFYDDGHVWLHRRARGINGVDMGECQNLFLRVSWERNDSHEDDECKGSKKLLSHQYLAKVGHFTH